MPPTAVGALALFLAATYYLRTSCVPVPLCASPASHVAPWTLGPLVRTHLLQSDLPAQSPHAEHAIVLLLLLERTITFAWRACVPGAECAVQA